MYHNFHVLTKRNLTEIPPTKGLHVKTSRKDPPHTRWRRFADSSAAAVASCGFFPSVAHAPISRSRTELPLACRLAAFIVAGIAWQFVSVIIIIIIIMVFFRPLFSKIISIAIIQTITHFDIFCSHS
jgi:hypothetical protein